MATAITPEEIKVGDTVTAFRWIKGGDRSYVGDVMTVEAVDLPFLVARTVVDKYGHDMDRGARSLDTREIEFGVVSNEYVNAMRNANSKAGRSLVEDED